MQQKLSQKTDPLTDTRQRCLNVKSFASLITAAVCILLTACTHSTQRSKTGPSPLVIASCPKLTPLNDNTFGATTLKLANVVHQYYECRRAAGVIDPEAP